MLYRSLVSLAPRLVARSVMRPSFIGVRSFGSSIVRLNESPAPSAADAELIAALRAEQKVEQDSLEEEHEEVQRFKDLATSQGFEIVESKGAEEVQLLRVNGNETIRVFFNISDVINSDSILDEEHEEGEGAAGGPEADADIEEETDFEAPIRLNIVVERPAGALSIEAVAQDDLIVVESIIPYKDGALATDESAEADYKRRASYQGPPFTVLDPSVQSSVQEFLESRNIDSRLALFVAEYSSFRENQEYISWLSRIADVIESQ